jgi:hypothetical protein
MMVAQHMLQPRSISGAPIEIWNRRVRLIYLDEAGISNPDEEPYLVIAGIIINPDQDWIALQRHLQSLVRKYLGHLPTQDRDNFVFHAKDIFHGSGHFPRATWDRSKRMELLVTLSEIPKRFHLPVVFGFVSRSVAAAIYRGTFSGISESEILDLSHADAFAQVARSVDDWMEKNAPSEVAMLIGERSGRIDNLLKAIHHAYSRYSDYVEKYTIKNIVDTVHFAGKKESVLLSIADMCAFIVKRRLAGKQDVDECFKQIHSRVIVPFYRASQDSDVIDLAGATLGTRGARGGGPTLLKARR